MDQTLADPPAMPFSMPLQPSDVDVEAITRKRQRIGARKKLKIIASAVIACNRLRITVEGEVEKPEQARTEILAALMSSVRLDEQSSSEESVIDCRYAGLYATHPDVVEGEVFTAAVNGFLSGPSQGYTPVLQTQTPQPFQQVVGEMFASSNPAPSFLSVPSHGYSTLPEGGTSQPIQQGIQHVQRLLDEPDEPDVFESLCKVDEISQHWIKFASDLSNRITKHIVTLQEASGREKVQKLVELAEEIAKKFEKPGWAPEATKPQKPRNFRDVERTLSDVFENLQYHINRLSPNISGQQCAAMSQLIDNGRKTLLNLGGGIDWASKKLNALVSELKFRDRIVEKYFQKCVESIPELTLSFLTKQKKNFISVASVADWYFKEKSTRQNMAHPSSSSSQSPPTFDAFLSVF